MPRLTGRSTTLLAALALMAACCNAQAALAPASASSAPLVRANNLLYLGAFRVPGGQIGSDPYDTLSYGGSVIALNTDRAIPSLFIVGHDTGGRVNDSIWNPGQKVAEISIPDPTNSTDTGRMQTATLLQAPFDVTGGNRNNLYFNGSVNTTTPSIAVNGSKIGGLLVHEGKLIGSAYAYYSTDANLSHFTAPLSLASSGGFSGMFQVGSAPAVPGASFVAGFMTKVPDDWQDALGGPALTGAGTLAILSRTSFGPAAFSFDPSRLGVDRPVGAAPLLYYPAEHPNLNPYHVGQVDAGNGPSPYMNWTTRIAGMTMIPGSRSVIYFGFHGIGMPTYGAPTDNPDFDGTTLCNQGTVCWYDPGGMGGKGPHAYPYVYQAWAYDANDMAAVRNGAKQPWDVLPYAVWTLPFKFANTEIYGGGAAYDAVNKRLYIAQPGADRYGYNVLPLIHVFQVDLAAPAADSYKVTGTVIMLNGTVVLRNNGGDEISVTAAPTEAKVFEFANRVAGSGAYQVTIVSKPEGQNCTVLHGSGLIDANADIGNIVVRCKNESEQNVPGIPTIETAAPGYGSVTVGFTAATGAGGTAITYTAACAAAGQATQTKTGAGSPLTVQPLTAGVAYSCSVSASNNAGTSASSAALAVTPLAGLNTVRNALFVNASTSPNKTSVIRLVSLDTHHGGLTATAYDEAGNIVGTAGADLGTFAAQRMLTFTSAQLETAIGYVPVSGTSKYRVVFNANLPSFEVINFIKDVATGNLSLGQAQAGKQATGTANASVRDALFVNASTSANKTSVLRLINPGDQSGIVTATAYDEAGSTVGTTGAALGALAGQQMRTFTSEQLEEAIGYNPASPTAKYKVVFNANLPGFEVINFIKDTATGNLALGQAQTYERGAATGNSATRNALFINASNNVNTTSVVRLINPDNRSGTISATAYDEAGSTVGMAGAFLGSLASGQIAAFTSAQLEAAIGYTPSTPDAKYRIVFNADLAGFELLNFIKDNASGNLVLAQAQIDDRAAGAATSSSRNALFVNASTSANKISIIRLINTGSQSGQISATVYDEAGNTAGTVNASLGTLAARQMLTFTSAQLEAALAYVPAAPTAKYRVVFNANLPSFEIVNYISDVATGNVTLGQAQVD